MKKYYKKGFSLSFSSEEEREKFSKLITDLKGKIGIKRNDIVIKMALELLRQKVYKKYQ